MPDETPHHRRRWRFYHTASGHEPVKTFLRHLSEEDRAETLAAMKTVEIKGLVAARHLRNDIYEVRASGATQNYRVLFATEGRYNHVLLALEAFSKKTQQTPNDEIDLAQTRLRDWRDRGA